MREKVPFSPEQIDALWDYQKSGIFHEYTCPNGPEMLFPCEQGLVCPTCGYTQDWAINWTVSKDSVNNMLNSIKESLITQTI